MHEGGLAHAAVDAVLARTAGRTVSRVRVAVAATVDPEVVRAEWEHAVGGTPLAGVGVEWQVVTDELSCLACGDDYRGDRLDPCPRCGGTGLVVGAAPELAVEDWD